MAEFSRTTITVNGQTYNSVDEMPPDVRRQYEQVMSLMADRNNNGVPDIMEGGELPRVPPGGQNTVISHVTTTTHQFGAGEMLRPKAKVLESREFGGGSGGGGGVTIHFSWSTVFALLAVVAIALVIWWVKR